jgi:hypothetical protein
MKPTLIYDRLDTLAGAHRSGHRCQDGQWYNPNAGARTPCPVSLSLAEVRQEVEAQHASVHEAAHDPETVEHVATAMLSGSPLGDLDPEQADGWRHLARLAIEALAEHLDRDPALEQRAAAVRARLAAAGLRMIDRAEALAEEGDRLP